MNRKLSVFQLVLIIVAMGCTAVAVLPHSSAAPSAGEFTPCTGYGTPPPGSEGRPGPWSNRLMIAYSDDGLAWTRAGRIVTDQADVPDAIVDDAGTLRVYYVTWCPQEVHNQIVVALSADAGQVWSYRRVTINGMAPGQPDAVDPDIVRTPDGKWRLYFTSAPATPGATPRTYSAISDDGFTFQVEAGDRLAVEGKAVLDPSALLIGDTWHLFAGGQLDTPGSNWHATSTDGLNFIRQDDFSAGGMMMANGLAVDGGYRFYGFRQSSQVVLWSDGQVVGLPTDQATSRPHDRLTKRPTDQLTDRLTDQPPIQPTTIYSVFTADGVTWTMDPGSRLSPDPSASLEALGVKDPAVARLPDGRYIMIYVTTIPEYLQPGSTPTPTQLPIHLLYVNHVEVESVIDYRPPLVDGTTYAATPDRYGYTAGQLEWEMAQAEAVGASISFHMSGAYAERAAAGGAQALWAQHLADGHTVGVHFHSFLRGSQPFQWTYRPSPTQGQITQAWQDNHDLVANLAGSDALWVGESHYACPSCWENLGYQLRSTEEMAQLPAGQHIVWLVERDPSGVITYPHFPQIGQAAWHGPTDSRAYFDLRVPQLKKEFLMLYLEWLERERLDLEPQVWAWGWVNHGGRNTELYAAQIQEMLAWLRDNFAGQTSPRGNVIAGFVSDHELSDVYEAYEQAGGQPLPSPTANVTDQFPYMAHALQDAGVTADLTGELGLPGVRLFELERNPAENPPAGPRPKVYLLFRETDGSSVVDMRGILASRGVSAAGLTLINVVDGTTRQVDPASVALGPTPLVLEPGDEPPTPPAEQCVHDINSNGQGDVADIEATAAELGCHVYLPLVVANWRQPWPTVPAPSDLTFVPDPGLRVDYASNPAPSVDLETGTVYLFYEDHSAGPGRSMVATSSDGLTFTAGRPPTEADNPHHPFHVRLPDGTWRKYLFDQAAGEFRSQSSTDGIHYTPDPGARYTLWPADNGTAGIHDEYVDLAGGVVLLYIGDMFGLNNVRRAYSPPGDNGWAFTFEDGNVLGDAGAGGGPHSYVDQKSILLPDGRRRLFTMKQGAVYSFISGDGKSYALEPGVRLSPSDFTEFPVRSLHDPVVVLLPDGRYRMYVAAGVDDGSGGNRWAIVSATAGAGP